MSGIIKLTVSNLMRIKAAEVTPDGALVVVAGRNDAGKSSLLNAIALALSGQDVPVQPIRQGAASGEVILETEDLVVTRRFSQTGGSTLEVRDKDGVRVTSPQSKLDALVSRVTFDPFEFTRMKPADQLSTVKRIAGLDFTELDAEHRKTFDLRTEVNRIARMQEAKVAGITRVPGVPEAEVSIGKLSDQLEEAHAKNAANEAARNELSDANDLVDDGARKVRLASKRIADLQAELENARAQLTDTQSVVEKITEGRDSLKTRVAELQDVDINVILTAMKESEQINAAVRANIIWKEQQKLLMEQQKLSQAYTKRLEQIEEAKSLALQSAKFPVAGLGFSETGVTYHGVPFEQAGTAVKIRTSVAIARSLNPKLPVMLIRDGSLLDSDSLAILTAEAEEHGSQIWMEVVGERDDATVLIEDGTVIATPAATKKAKSVTNKPNGQ